MKLLTICYSLRLISCALVADSGFAQRFEPSLPMPPAAFAQRPEPPLPPPPPAFAKPKIAMHKPGGSYLGIGVAEIDADRAKALNLKEERGVEVKSIDEDSPAAKAGVKEGDVVLEYNGQRVEGTEQFMRMVRETPPGRQCRLLISRSGATQTLTATLGTRSAKFMKGDFPGNWEGFEFQMPDINIRLPEIRIPDVPRTFMSWRSSALGIESESLNTQLAEFFGVKEGVLIRSVAKDSAGEKAGLKAGDVITKVNDTKITSSREISSALRALGSKRTFPIVVVRNRKEITLNVTLDEHSGVAALTPRV